MYKTSSDEGPVGMACAPASGFLPLAILRKAARTNRSDHRDTRGKRAGRALSVPAHLTPEFPTPSQSELSVEESVFSVEFT